ncbi:hypothetical protein KFK09_006839 [Dendrobium nobile]|uniref:Copia protein n=1 Tax=Dendrobium nobile TaxID=94219 RepID=A0A8T3BV58_DENNO|nr:hypothetical protein KFK09_006839 [Dendrobium nobile]
MTLGICELLWIKIILEDLKVKWDEPMKLHCDNKSAISIAHNPVQHDRTKHIEVDRHFIKEKLDSGLVGFMSNLVLGLSPPRGTQREEVATSTSTLVVALQPLSFRLDATNAYVAPATEGTEASHALSGTLSQICLEGTKAIHAILPPISLTLK